MKICQLCTVDFTLYHFLLPLNQTIALVELDIVTNFDCPCEEVVGYAPLGCQHRTWGQVWLDRPHRLAEGDGGVLYARAGNKPRVSVKDARFRHTVVDGAGGFNRSGWRFSGLYRGRGYGGRRI